MGFFEKMFRGKKEEKPAPVNDEELGDDDFEIVETEPVSTESDNRDPEMVDAKVDESGKFGQPKVFSEASLSKEIGSPESALENDFLEGLVNEVVSERGGPFGRLIAPYDDMTRKLKQRLSSALQNLRVENRHTPMTHDEMRESLLKEGVDIAEEIFNANKKRIEKDLDNPERMAS